MTTQLDVFRPDRSPPRWALGLYEALVPRLPPAALRGIARLVLRLPRGSRLRRWCVLMLSMTAWDMTARGRLELVLPLWEPVGEWYWDTPFRPLGFDELYRGYEGVRRSLVQWNEVWTDRVFTVHEVLDGGGTWVLRVRASGRGATSGAPTTMEFSSLVRLQPRIVEFRNFANHEDAMHEAGFVSAPATTQTGSR